MNSLSSSSSSLSSLDDVSLFKNGIEVILKQQLNKPDDLNASETPSSGISCEYSSSPQEDVFSEILVVSHGALIRELIKYFAYDLKCEMPVSLDMIKQVPNNTALSKFTICVSENEPPKVTCHLFNDREHLAYTNLETKTLCNM